MPQWLLSYQAKCELLHQITKSRLIGLLRASFEINWQRFCFKSLFISSSRPLSAFFHPCVSLLGQTIQNNSNSQRFGWRGGDNPFFWPIFFFLCFCVFVFCFVDNLSIRYTSSLWFLHLFVLVSALKDILVDRAIHNQDEWDDDKWPIGCDHPNGICTDLHTIQVFINNGTSCCC